MSAVRSIVLAAIPQGIPQQTDFRLETMESPACPPDGVLVKTAWISVDPYLRGRMTGGWRGGPTLRCAPETRQGVRHSRVRHSRLRRPPGLSGGLGYPGPGGRTRASCEIGR